MNWEKHLVEHEVTCSHITEYIGLKGFQTYARVLGNG